MTTTKTTALLPRIDVPEYDGEQKQKNEERSQARWHAAGVASGYPCIVCGTFTGPNPTKMLHICGGGGDVADPNEPHVALGIMDENSAGCLAFYPIGGSCLKKFPALRAYAVTRVSA